MWQSALQKMQTEPLQAAQMFHSIAETFASHAKVEVNYVTPTNTLPLHLHESALLQYAKILVAYCRICCFLPSDPMIVPIVRPQALLTLTPQLHQSIHCFSQPSLFICNRRLCMSATWTAPILTFFPRLQSWAILEKKRCGLS